MVFFLHTKFNLIFFLEISKFIVLISNIIVAQCSGVTFAVKGQGKFRSRRERGNLESF